MKRILLLLVIIIPVCLKAQFGLKAGLNFANITKASEINGSSRTGFAVGVYLAPQSSGILGFRTELLFSRQGYNYKTATNTGNVDLNYIMLPQLLCINITKYFQIQAGGQMSFLLNAKVDSAKNTTPTSGSKIMDAFNKFDYGYALGVEVHPVKGLIIGARYNVSLGNLYKTDGTVPTAQSFIPKIDAKNNVVQLFVGWTFGKAKK